MKKYIILMASVAMTALVLETQAQITYVDATQGGNTFIAPSAGGGSAFTFGNFGDQGGANDGLWDARAFGNSATIFQNASAGAGVDVNAVRLVTSVSGLPLGTYDLYVYFWTDSSPIWRIGASLNDTPGQLTLYQASTPGVVQYYTGTDATVLSTSLAQNPFTTGVMIGEGNRRLLQASLGSVTGTGFDIFLEGDRNMVAQNERTWYDGVGYALVPEPAAGALLGLGLGVLWVRRRTASSH